VKEGFEEAVSKLQEILSEETRKKYSEKAIDYFTNPRNFGRKNDPDGSAMVKGICGDTMEIYLEIKDNTVTSCTFYSDGCGNTLACGSSVTELVKGKSIEAILQISPYSVINDLGKLPEEGLHCAILSVITLHKAVADYLLSRV
jgi:nitrogen fixation protein NifU and related proteins